MPIWPLWKVAGGVDGSSANAGDAASMHAIRIHRTNATLSRLARARRRRYLPRMLTRRDLLGGAAALAVLATARRARAIGPASKFRFGQLQIGAGTSWNPRPRALERLAWEVSKRTS